MSLVTGADREIARHEVVKFNLHRICSVLVLQSDALRIITEGQFGSLPLMSDLELLFPLVCHYRTTHFYRLIFALLQIVKPI